MKKFFLGLTCGIVLCFATGAAASSTIQAVLFPSTIKMHGEEGVKEITGSNGAILNYNNRVYVPLRSFAEAMGANINYAPPSGNTLPRVDIYADPNAGAIHISENQLMYSDAENYVSVGYIKSSGIKPNTLDVGVLKIHKDISNKTIKIEALNKDGFVLGTSPYVYI